MHSHDKNKRGYIEEVDFLCFYEEAAVSKPIVVWKNLKNLGYDDNLKKLGA